MDLIVHGERVGRSCGTCSLCCTVMAVAEIEKPRNTRCCHLNTLGRCAVYPTRPDSCRQFSCTWLLGMLPKALSPERIHAVGDTNLAGDALVFHVDPRFPRAHERGVFKQFIERVAAKVLIIVLIGDTRVVYGPNREQVEVVSLDPTGAGGVR